jgi:hypothetical protein
LTEDLSDPGHQPLAPSAAPCVAPRPSRIARRSMQRRDRSMRPPCQTEARSPTHRHRAGLETESPSGSSRSTRRRRGSFRQVGADPPRGTGPLPSRLERGERHQEEDERRRPARTVTVRPERPADPIKACDREGPGSPPWS